MSSSYFVVRAGSTAVTNEAISSGISHTALGILIRALSSRPGASLGYRDFMTDGVGERLVRRSLTELESAGLRHRVLTRAGCGSLRTVVIYCDVPMDATDVITQIDGLHLIKVQSERGPKWAAIRPGRTVQTQCRHGLNRQKTLFPLFAPCRRYRSTVNRSTVDRSTVSPGRFPTGTQSPPGNCNQPSLRPPLRPSAVRAAVGRLRRRRARLTALGSANPPRNLI